MPQFPHRESEFDSAAGPHRGPDMRLSVKHRLTTSSLFSETFSQNHYWTGRYMVLWLRLGKDASLRLGVVTSKKVSPQAVKRNRVRRRLREAYRRCRPFFSGNADIILVGRSTAIHASWQELVEELLELARKAGLITEENLKKARAKHGLC